MRAWKLFGIGVVAVSAAFGKFPDDFGQRLDVIALGSCNRESLPQPMWEVVDSFEPELWIWMGDNIYGDSRDMAVMSAKYSRQFNQPKYAAFREKTPIIGTWDDHDYGENNAGAWYPKKAESSELALKFFEVPPEDPRWSREGIYGAYTFGPTGQQVKVMLVDGRYFADDIQADDPHLLGEAQWAWLQEELKSSDAQINLIVSGIQFLPQDHRFEKWANYPASRQALLDFIREEKVPGVIFASGDRHIHELSLKNDADTAYPLLELTSSGMTHSWGKRFPGEANRFRIGPVFPMNGFGLFRIDWDAEPMTVTAEIIDEDGEPVNTISLPLPSLQPHADLDQ